MYYENQVKNVGMYNYNNYKSKFIEYSFYFENNLINIKKDKNNSKKISYKTIHNFLHMLIVK